MKTTYYKATALFAFILITLPLLAQVQIMNIAVSNPPATSCSSTDLTVSGQVWSSYPLDQINVNQSGNSIVINVIYQDVIASPTITNFSHNVQIGQLAAGNYQVIGNGYLGRSLKSTLNNNLSVNAGGPIVNLGPDTTLCIGDSILLNASSANASYSWSTSSLDSAIWVKSAGVYSVIVSDGSGCSASDTINVSFTSCSTGLNDIFSSEALNIFPNPASSFLTIDCPKAWLGENIEITLRDLKGSNMINLRVVNAKEQLNLAIPQLPNGIYVLDLKTNLKSLNRKISIVQ